MLKSACMVAAAVFSFTLASSAHASDTYDALHRSQRRGSEVLRVQAAALFVWDRLYRDAHDVSGFYCSIRSLIPEDRGAGFHAVIARDIARMTEVNTEDALIALTSGDCARPSPVAIEKASERHSLVLDARGIPVSVNPVWNACIRGLPLSADFMKTNPDVVIHRQRRIRKTKPLSCRDYHRGDIRVWDYPGHPGVALVLDIRGRMLGDPPTDFVIKKGFSASQ